MRTQRFQDPASALAFIFAGNSRTTLKSLKTGNHFTYRTRVSDDGGIRWVSVLADGDNVNGYDYIGYVKNGKFVAGKKTDPANPPASFTAYSWMLTTLQSAVMPKNAEVWHEGTCGRCNRTLTHPESIESGFGPECIKHRK